MPTAKRTPELDAPKNAEALHAWIQEHLELNIATRPIIPGHAAPFDYLQHAFFEGSGALNHKPDCLIWANRGGGKTLLGAIATTLDLLFKPQTQVRILAGSLDQAQRMHEHLRTFFERPRLKKHVKGRITDQRITLKNKAAVTLLAQSQASVRGQRPQKLRCDEVELFDPAVWAAAQLTTRSITVKGQLIHGAVECFSTMHRVHGLMSKLIEDPNRRLFKWGVIDNLERCPDQADCTKCSLFPECRGEAKKARTGHIPIHDAIRMKSRVSLPIWNSEMLCIRPIRTDAVFPEFDRAIHTTTHEPTIGMWLGGMDFGLRSPTVFLWAVLEPAGRLVIVDEHHEANQTIPYHIKRIVSSKNPIPSWVGVDPAGKSRNDQTGKSNISLLRHHGLNAVFRHMPIAAGISLIHARLQPADNSPPRLVIHQRCKRLIESLEQYHYDPGRPLANEPVKDGPDHAVDALRYLITNLDEPHRIEFGHYAG